VEEVEEVDEVVLVRRDGRLLLEERKGTAWVKP
jgi:hypothetical protein